LGERSLNEEGVKLGDDGLPDLLLDVAIEVSLDVLDRGKQLLDHGNRRVELFDLLFERAGTRGGHRTGSMERARC